MLNMKGLAAVAFIAYEVMIVLPSSAAAQHGQCGILSCMHTPNTHLDSKSPLLAIQGAFRERTHPSVAFDIS